MVARAPSTFRWVFLALAVLSVVVALLWTSDRPQQDPDAGGMHLEEAELLPQLLGTRVQPPEVATEPATSPVVHEARITGLCVGSAGVGVPVGEVLLQSAAAGRPVVTLAHTVLDVDGRFSVLLPDGSRHLSLLVNSTGHSQAHIPVPQAIAERGGDIGRIYLPTGVRVTGELLDANGASAAGRVLTWSSPVLGSRWGEALLDGTAFTTGTAETDEHGRFDFGLVLPGTIYCWAGGRGHSRAALGSHPVPPHRANCELLLREPAYEETVFRLNVDEGNPLPSRVLVAGTPTVWEGPVKQSELDVDDAGMLTLSLPRGYRGELRFQAEGFYHSDVRVNPAWEQPVVVPLRTSPGQVSVQLPQGWSGKRVLLGALLEGPRRTRLPRFFEAVADDDAVLTHPFLETCVRDHLRALVVTTDWSAGCTSLHPDEPPVAGERLRLEVEELKSSKLTVSVDDDMAAGGGRQAGHLEVRRALGRGGSCLRSARGRAMSTASGWALLDESLQRHRLDASGGVSIFLVSGFQYEVVLVSPGRAEARMPVGPSVPSSIRFETAVGGVLDLEVGQDILHRWGSLTLVPREGGPAVTTISAPGAHRIVALRGGVYCLTPSSLASWVASLPRWQGLQEIPGFLVFELAIDGTNKHTVDVAPRPSWLSATLSGKALGAWLVDLVPAASATIPSPIAAVSPGVGGQIEMGPLPAGRYALRVFENGLLKSTEWIELRAGKVLKLKLEIRD